MKIELPLAVGLHYQLTEKSVPTFNLRDLRVEVIDSLSSQGVLNRMKLIMERFPFIAFYTLARL